MLACVCIKVYVFMLATWLWAYKLKIHANWGNRRPFEIYQSSPDLPSFRRSLANYSSLLEVGYGTRFKRKMSFIPKLIIFRVN